jgi:colicin import membrane protein
MVSRTSRIDTGMSASFIASAVIHLAVFLLLAWYGRLMPLQTPIQETYYVDVINLPTANPQSGTPAQKPAESEAAPPPPLLIPPSMALPLSVTSPKAINKPALVPVPQKSEASDTAFAERMAKLERNAEARREDAVFDKLRSKVKAGGSSKIGMPGAGGAEAGSRYGDYIKSRLEDALKVTSSYSTKNPEVVVRLTIAPDGRLSWIKIERSSGDATFELAVRRAIDLASVKFTVPPGRTVYENGFVFKPRSISSGTSR